MSKYFQVASSERWFRLKYTRGAEDNVAVSIATHMSPRWWERITSDMAARKASRAEQKMFVLLSRRRARYPGT